MAQSGVPTKASLARASFSLGADSVSHTPSLSHLLVQEGTTMPSGGTFYDPLSEGLHALEHDEVEGRAHQARDEFEAAFMAKCPDDASPDAWLLKLHECTSEGLWEDGWDGEAREEAEQLVEKAEAEFLETPVARDQSDALGPEWGSDGDGNWFTEDAAIWITEAGEIYKGIAGSWAGYAEYWESLLREFEADPDGFVARVMSGEEV